MLRNQRNELAHGYDHRAKSVNWPNVWYIIEYIFPPLVGAIEDAMQDMMFWNIEIPDYGKNVSHFLILRQLLSVHSFCLCKPRTDTFIEP